MTTTEQATMTSTVTATRKRTDRRHRVWRVRRLGPDGVAKATRWYAREAAARRRAEAWQRAGFAVELAATPEPVRLADMPWP